MNVELLASCCAIAVFLWTAPWSYGGLWGYYMEKGRHRAELERRRAGKE